MYFVYKIFVPSEIWTHFYIHTPYFLHFQIWTFWPRKPKNSNFTNSFLEHYPQPKMNQKIPKDPKSILILTMKLLWTHIWKTLPVSDLISLSLISIAFSKSSQISPSSSNHLMSSISGPDMSGSKGGSSTLSAPCLCQFCDIVVPSLWECNRERWRLEGMTCQINHNNGTLSSPSTLCPSFCISYLYHAHASARKFRFSDLSFCIDLCMHVKNYLVWNYNLGF